MTFVPEYDYKGNFIRNTGVDTALVCRNGHLATTTYLAEGRRKHGRYCQCKAKYISACEVCEKPIPGRDWDLGEGVILVPSAAPILCQYCGTPYPWSQGFKYRVGQVITWLAGLFPSSMPEGVRRGLVGVIVMVGTPVAVVAAPDIYKALKTLVVTQTPEPAKQTDQTKKGQAPLKQ